MKRADWLQRLDECIAAARTRTFEYGSFDCMLFAADCMLATHDVDYAAQFRGYDSKVAAYKIVARYGSLEAMVTALLGVEPKHGAFAMRGEPVIAELQITEGLRADCIGICYGHHCLFPQELGLLVYPRSVARLSWSIEQCRRQ